MNKELRNDVNLIIEQLVKDINPYEKTKECLSKLSFNNGKTILVSIGKAAWIMAKAVCDNIEVDKGVVITKYKHSKGEIKNVKVFEAGHPVTDENSIKATEYVLETTNNLKENDNVILCISGGGSALFEKPLIPLNELQDINSKLLKSGADINEINTIRKRLSSVKAGRFALHCFPARISSIILSDVVGDDLGTVASGPAFEDKTTSIEAIEIINKYNITISDEIKELLKKETPKKLDNVDSYMIGSVRLLCNSTKTICEKLGYETEIFDRECKDNVVEIAEKFKELLNKDEHNKAYITGGESVVEVKGTGLGGRNSELALLCSRYINDDNKCVFTFGSDGTDGPTDAAGGYVDKETKELINIEEYLKNSDSYHGLEKTDGLIITGPTGSNVNDVYVVLIK